MAGGDSYCVVNTPFFSLIHHRADNRFGGFVFYGGFMAVCRCGSREFRSEVVEERSYGYGGYRDYDEFTSIEIHCRACGRLFASYGICELEALALEDAQQRE